MSNKPFHYQDPFPLKEDDTEYYLVSNNHVSVTQFEGHDMLKVEPEALTLLAEQVLGGDTTVFEHQFHSG